jgi:hypothetical protein
MNDGTIALVVAGALCFVFLLALVAMRRGGEPLHTARLQHIDGRLGAVEKSLEDTMHDLRNVRMVVGNLPTKDAVHRIELELTGVAGSVKGLQAEVTATSRAVNRVVDLLLDKSGT